MNVGRAITEAMREQRMKDWNRMAWANADHWHRLYAYVQWGWAIHGKRHLGKPGVNV